MLCVGAGDDVGGTERELCEVEQVSRRRLSRSRYVCVCVQRVDHCWGSRRDTRGGISSCIVLSQPRRPLRSSDRVGGGGWRIYEFSTEGCAKWLERGNQTTFVAFIVFSVICFDKK